jgi:hypothetical protein
MSQLALTGKEKMNGESWVEINHDDVAADVRALAINPTVTFLREGMLEVPLTTNSARQMTVIVGRRRNKGLGCRTLALWQLIHAATCRNYQLRQWRLAFD